MKKILMLTLAAAAFTGCSKEGGNAEGPAEKLNILTSISTRSAIDGTGMPVGSSIGVHVTNNSSAYTGIDGTDDNKYLNGQNVRFTNAAGENNWASVNEDNTAPKQLLLGTETGTVYAYYPFVKKVDGVGDEAAIPVSILNKGVIDVSGATDGTNGTAPAVTAEEENDYLYDGQGSRPSVSASTTTTAKLKMEHALARVSFIVYTANGAPKAVAGDDASTYRLGGYVIKNKTGKTLLHANVPELTEEANFSKADHAYMKISDGTISGTLSGGQIERAVKNYVMARSASDDKTGDEAAAKACKRVSNLVFPIANIPVSTVNNESVSDDLEVVFAIESYADGSETPAKTANYAIPFAVVAGQSDSWDAGKNYTYTVKFTGTALSIETVTVTDWTEVVGGDMEIE